MKKFCVIGSAVPTRDVNVSRRTYFATAEETVEYAKTLVRRNLQRAPNTPVELYVVEVIKVVGTLQPEIQVRDLAAYDTLPETAAEE